MASPGPSWPSWPIEFDLDHCADLEFSLNIFRLRISSILGSFQPYFCFTLKIYEKIWWAFIGIASNLLFDLDQLHCEVSFVCFGDLSNISKKNYELFSREGKMVWEKPRAMGSRDCGRWLAVIFRDVWNDARSLVGAQFDGETELCKVGETLTFSKEDWTRMERGDFPSSQSSDLSLNETRSAGGEGNIFLKEIYTIEILFM